jgi:hypothetical protein
MFCSLCFRNVSRIRSLRAHDLSVTYTYVCVCVCVRSPNQFGQIRCQHTFVGELERRLTLFRLGWNVKTTGEVRNVEPVACLP